MQLWGNLSRTYLLRWQDERIFSAHIYFETPHDRTQQEFQKMGAFEILFQANHHKSKTQ